MTVKVVSPAPVKTKRVVCGRCGYELEYTGVGVQGRHYVDPRDGGETVYWIRCPHEGCGHDTLVAPWR